MFKSFKDYPIATIEKALAIRKQIEALQESIDEILGGAKESTRLVDVAVSSKSAKGAAADGRKGKRSAATRAKMAAAQQARWAKKNGASTKAAPKASVVNGAKKKRTMSPEARARIAAAQRARWAKQKAA
jgi:hypothetical protein